MKKTILKLGSLLLLFAVAGVLSCEGPEGPQGPQGPAGPAGAAGAAGATGATGATGAAGQEGNANVKIVTLLSKDITWIEGEYLGRPANVFSLAADEVNDDIMDHGTVLGYCSLFGEWFHLPLTWEDESGSTRLYVLHSYSPNTITLYAYETGGVLDPVDIEEYRFLLITDFTITSPKGISAEEEILKKLSKAGVDVNNYQEVMTYFELKY